jgi:hypothetical protein
MLLHSLKKTILPLGLGLICIMAPVMAQSAGAVNPLSVEGPVAPALGAKAADQLPVFDTGAVDIYMLRAEAEDIIGEAPRFADPVDVSITPETDGVWEELDPRFQLWQLRVTAPGALSLNFGITDFQLPKGARLTIYPADLQGSDDARGVRVFTALDNRDHGELWTPVVVSDDVILELVLPTESRQDYRLELTSVNRGFRFLGEEVDKSGSCNIDVVCPEGDPWWSEINSNGVYTVNGTWYCSGAVINNTAEDGTPYFLTANHCGLSTSNDQGVVIYWNFQSPVCGQQSGGSLAQYSSGVTYLASSSASDVCLVLINDPLDPDFNVTFSGWDRSGDDVSEAVAIHHPSCDEKSISFEYDPTQTTSYLGTSVPGDGTHIRVVDWDLGTTEPGSSGSPLYSPEHRIIGQLHGGYASCTSQTSDYYGKLSISFPLLSQWLDPLNTGAVTLDTYDPFALGMNVTSGSFDATGDSGGPFVPSSTTYTVTNQGDYSISYSVTADVDWVTVSNGSGTLGAGSNASVTVSLNSNAEALPNGGYSGSLVFSNLTDGEGDTVRQLSLVVGLPQLVHSVGMDRDPQWTMEGQWAHGVPTGGGGQYGNNDPTGAYTGSNVLGYNLGGDYANNLPETHLTSTPFDCSDMSGVTLKFWRWLNVEQPSYDHATIYVSNNGSDWSQVWTNGSEITDSSWSQQEYDISAVADGQPAVYLRWTMGTTDGSWQYSGWNIDDVELWGVTSAASPADDTPAFKLSLGNYPNPFNPLTKIQFSLERTGSASLKVYDVQGRLVRQLVDRVLTVGPHSVVWDGMDDHGQRAGSGVYFARLVSGGQVAEHKMVLLK